MPFKQKGKKNQKILKKIDKMTFSHTAHMYRRIIITLLEKSSLVV